MDSQANKQTGDGKNDDGHGKGRRRGRSRTDSDTVSGLTLDSHAGPIEGCDMDSVSGLTLDSLPELSSRRRRIEAARNALRLAVGEESRALARVMRQNEMLSKRLGGIKGISSGTIRMAEAAIEACQDAMEAAATRGSYQGLLEDQLEILLKKEEDWREKESNRPTASEAVEGPSYRGEPPAMVEAWVQTDPFHFSGVESVQDKGSEGEARTAVQQQKRKVTSPAEGADAGLKRTRSVRGRVTQRAALAPVTVQVGPEPPRSAIDRRVGGASSTNTDLGWSIVTGRGRRARGDQAPAGSVQTTSGVGLVAPGGTLQVQPANTRDRVRTIRAKAKPPAVAVKIPKNMTYADTLKRIRSGTAITEDMGRVTGIRRTRTGDMLIELDRKSAACVDKMKEAITAKLGDEGTVKALQPRMDVEVRDLDDITAAGELKEAVYEAIGRDTLNQTVATDVMVKALVKGFGERKKAILSLPEAIAKKVVRLGHLTVGWVSCRVRFAASPPIRCFRCHRPGHVAAQCTLYAEGMVVCRQCGGVGHIMTDCTKAIQCIMCTEKGLPVDATRHVVGSARCPLMKTQAASKSPT